MTRKEIKTRARQTVKRHYMILVMTGLIAVFLGLQISSFDDAVRMYSSESVKAADLNIGTGEGTEETADTRVAMGSVGLMDVVEHAALEDA